MSCFLIGEGDKSPEWGYQPCAQNSSANGLSSSPAWLWLLLPSVLSRSPGLTRAAAALGMLGEPVPSPPARPQGVGAAHGPRRADGHGAVGAADGLATEPHDP